MMDVGPFGTAENLALASGSTAFSRKRLGGRALSVDDAPESSVGQRPMSSQSDIVQSGFYLIRSVAVKGAAWKS